MSSPIIRSSHHQVLYILIIEQTTLTLKIMKYIFKIMNSYVHHNSSEFIIIFNTVSDNITDGLKKLLFSIPISIHYQKIICQ